ncbi:hypothetical protein COCMIDRAFT_38490 [Bipolaris oryzae ATCC 44560]|uniref:Tyrosinase copper-binding domain-containing protein n=1 Tax=Bipolaris oryzae ATCC 44560 TaxID=930090 RepID=W6YW27_COCMI|nr:uncharacterized protein COCMIDRAFT_38490 [Bipolaris oryzae ATCC 44560]EUC43622.1 hypothetical protein COCMIDRAFT_38490 [Bipolaris oryzae ATCC 44560]
MFFTPFAILALVLPVPAMSSSNCTCTPETIQTFNCLMQLPGQTGINGTVTRFDDMHAMHQVQAKEIHLVAQFLPFHRLYIQVYEQLLREECGYTGPTPWWDETRDAGNFMGSPLLDPNTGFGGNGTAPDGCVTNGPFANTTLRIGPGQKQEVHCLSRKVEERNSTLANETYIGGVMEDIDASPGDPLFYLHHAFVDRLWWNWQSEDPDNRLYQLGGSSSQGPCEEECEETTLDYVMTTYEILPNVTVRDVMDIQGGYLCYKYDY